MMAWGHGGKCRQRRPEDRLFRERNQWFAHFFYLLAGDGDPLEAVLAHQVLEGQLQFHIALGRAGGVAGAVGHGDLLQETKRGMPPLA